MTDLTATIDFENAAPLREQVATLLREQLTENAAKPGERLPSIREFAAKYGVSRKLTMNPERSLVSIGCLPSCATNALAADIV